MVLNEAITAKMYLVEKYLQTIKVFREHNADTIGKSLKEDEEEAKGYIEVAKRTLTRINTSAEDRDGFSENDASGSERLKRGLEQCHAVEELMRKLSTIRLSKGGGEIIIAPTRDAELCAVAYQRSAKEVEERTGRMLERKMAKAKVGLEIADEVGVLMGEAGELIM
ncbi:hypothetical protein P691DRAFT_807420 [Macrolepiota fuliginosa MF-IS2]|uniref:Uncharacterized protein n=1 Tax=Macrolepiota fuliginosa MF-IS2 TaxID=1400762 RepID=A0A9P5XHN5_9AGAR|nr:hypothetical protein P691DRAFT_807420 [Macrolepiota fuliginosa MF-IS2]